MAGSFSEVDFRYIKVDFNIFIRKMRKYIGIKNFSPLPFCLGNRFSKKPCLMEGVIFLCLRGVISTWARFGRVAAWVKLSRFSCLTRICVFQ